MILRFPRHALGFAAFELSIRRLGIEG